MKLVVFGATGASGRLLVGKALAAGHEVKAYVRHPAKLQIRSAKLQIAIGELSDAAAIADVVAGAGAVISLLGPKGKFSGTPIADGMRRIVAAMEKHGVKRLIATVPPSVVDPGDRFRFSFWLEEKVFKAVAGNVHHEISETSKVIMTSSLDWILVRLPLLTNRPAKRPAVAGFIGNPRIKLLWLSREALADFLLAQLEETEWLYKAPAISNG